MHSVVAIMICACLLQVSLQEVDRQAYLAYLLGEKQTLEEALKKIETVDSNLRVNVQLSNSSVFQEHLLVSALRDQSSLLIQALSHTFLGMAEKSGCDAVGIDEIYGKARQMQEELKKVKETVEKQQSCVRNDIIKNNFAFYKTMAQGLVKETHSDCSIINSDTNISCPAGTSYNSVSRSCISLSENFNSNLAKNANYIGTAPTLTQGFQICPDNKPFFNGKSCISCALPLYYNFTSNTCIACAIGLTFDNIAHSCTGKSFFLSNLGNNVNYIGSPLSPLPYDKVLVCPTNKPFSDGKQCYSCNLPQFFNFQRMACQSCPSGYDFQIISHSCESTSSIVSFFNSNLIGHRNFNGKIPLFNNLFGSCGQEAPFFNGKQCVRCSLPSYFDFDIKACTLCQSGLTFNTLIQACEYIKQDFSTNFQANNIYYNGNFQEMKQFIIERRTKSANLSVCALSAPYYNSRTNSCIACTDNLPLFDLKSNNCISCPNGSVYSSQSHICLADRVPATIERMIMNTA